MSKLLLKSDFDNVFDRTHKREIYENFNEDEKRILMQWFEKNPYPKNEEYEIISQEIAKPMNKIQNWFKYHRRLSAMESEDNIPQYKSKNVLHPLVFSKLKEYFTQNQNPSIKEFRELSKTLNLKETQINSWFTYRRRKLRISQTINKKSRQIRKTKKEKQGKVFQNKIKKAYKKKIPMQIPIPKEEFIREEIAPIKQEYEPAAIRTIVKQEGPSEISPQISTFPIQFPMQNMNFYKQMVSIMPMNFQRNLMRGYNQPFMMMNNMNMTNMNMNRSIYGGIQQPWQMMPRQQFLFGSTPNSGFYGKRF